MTVGPNKRIKAPKVFQGTPGKQSKLPSSTKKPRPVGVTDPSKPSFGINHSSRFSGQDQAASRADRLFGSGSANTSNQGQIAKKAKRQVG